MTGLIVFVVIAVIIVLWVISIYNSLVRLRNNRENASADIDVQLKQRYDMIPQLVSTVKGYAAHEKTLLDEVTRARTAAMSATSKQQAVYIQSQFVPKIIVDEITVGILHIEIMVSLWYGIGLRDAGDDLQIVIYLATFAN